MNDLGGTPATSEKDQDVDLAKMSGSDYLSLAKRISTGTSGGTLVKIFGTMAAGLVLFGGLMFGLGKAAQFLEAPSDIAKPLEIPQNPIKPATQGDLALEEIVRAKNNEIDALKASIAQLQGRIAKKPNYVTCMTYGNELTALRKKKDAIEDYIQRLLYPVPPLEYQRQNLAYTVEQVALFKELASEHRKTAVDVQQQILALESNRRDCD